MDLRQLRYFVAIVEHGSFSKAAGALNVAQPALSLHVRNMETALGTDLLFRGPHGVVTTEAGDILLRNARTIIDQFAIAQDQIRGYGAEPAGEVRLGLPGTISQILSVPLIIEAKRRYPNIKLRIAEAMSGFVLEWIREAQVDLAVLYFPLSDRALTSLPILTEELWLLGPARPMAGVVLSAKASVPFKKVAQLPLILPSLNHGLRELLDREATHHSLVLNTVIEVDSYANIKALVEAGLGYSILPFNSIAREVQAGRIRAWKLNKPELKRQVHLVHSVDRPLKQAVAAIETLCKSTLLNLAATGEWSGAHALKQQSSATEFKSTR
jgi:LysR family nitrogen assimilation transcriptional regulator